MERVARILSWVSAGLALFCALGWALTFVGVNLLAALSGFAFCLLFLLIVPLIWYSNRLGIHGVMDWHTIVGWQRLVALVLFLFVFLNFGWNFMQLREGSPEREGEGYVLRNRGTLVRELTETEYDALQVAQVRIFSGHPVLFFTLATFGWQQVARHLKQRESLRSERHSV